MKKTKLIVLVGPSGSGKTELCARLCARSEDPFKRIITATTRPPRDGEKHGVDYWFLSDEEFDLRIANGDFVEWAWVHGKYRYGTLLGTTRSQILEGGRLVINIEIQGYRSVKANHDPVIRDALVGIFILTSDFPTLERRIRKRGSVDEEEIHRRLETARKELLAVNEFDWRVVNDDGKIEEALAEIIRIADM